jgi:hypothetical protein
MAQNKLALVVLAAGIGSRYGGLKQVDPVGPSGEMIIDYSIFDALRVGFDKVVFVISKAIEEVFHERVGSVIDRQCQTAYVIQRLEDLPAGCSVPDGRVKPWGTAHAALTAHSVVDTPFAVINADDFYGRGALQAVADYLLTNPPASTQGLATYCMVGYRLENTLTEHGHVARGICSVDAGGHLRGVRELTRIEHIGDGAGYTEDGTIWNPLPLDAVVSMNMWGFTPGLFPELKARFSKFLEANQANILKAEYFLPSVVNDLVNEKRAQVTVLNTTERWYGMTYLQDRPVVKAAIHELVRQGVYPEKLWKE